MKNGTRTFILLASMAFVSSPALGATYACTDQTTSVRIGDRVVSTEVAEPVERRLVDRRKLIAWQDGTQMRIGEGAGYDLYVERSGEPPFVVQLHWSGRTVVGIGISRPAGDGAWTDVEATCVEVSHGG